MKVPTRPNLRVFLLTLRRLDTEAARILVENEFKAAMLYWVERCGGDVEKFKKEYCDEEK